jgi:hypothetical protein
VIVGQVVLMSTGPDAPGNRRIDFNAGFIAASAINTLFYVP